MLMLQVLLVLVQVLLVVQVLQVVQVLLVALVLLRLHVLVAALGLLDVTLAGQQASSTLASSELQQVAAWAQMQSKQGLGPRD